MAIDDLIGRIEADAAEEAAAILAAARVQAEELLARADASVKAERAAALAEAERSAREEAATLLANARLASRDALLARKREAAEAVLQRAQTSLEALPDGEYVELIAAAVARVAAEGDELAVAPADAKRLAGLAARLGELGVAARVSGEAAELEHGVLLTGDRVRVEVSPASLIDDARDELLLVASRTLFGGKD